MAPSVAQLPEDGTAAAVPIKSLSISETTEAPRVKRQIDKEGGKTTAKVM